MEIERLRQLVDELATLARDAHRELEAKGNVDPTSILGAGGSDAGSAYASARPDRRAFWSYLERLPAHELRTVLEVMYAGRDWADDEFTPGYVAELLEDRPEPNPDGAVISIFEKMRPLPDYLARGLRLIDGALAG